MAESKHLEDDLIERIKSGDERAYTILHGDFYLPLFHFTYSLIKDQATAEDIVSTTFMKLWQMHDRFNRLQDIKAFMYTVCRNEAYDFLRYRYGKTDKHTILSDNIESLLDDIKSDENISQAIIQTEVLNTIYQEISKLPAQRQQVIKMLFIEELDTRTVAELTGLSEGSVRSTKAKAIEQLRNNKLLQKLIISFLLIWLSFTH